MSIPRKRSPGGGTRSRLSPQDYPTFFAFGRYHKFLTIAEAQKATPEERIQSIWPFITRAVIRFVTSLHQREVANYDADDLLMEIWVELRQKDAKWCPTRGTYVSFAARIICHLLSRLKEKSRTVESPRNSACRLARYRDIVKHGGVLDAARQKSQGDIDRTISGTSHLGGYTVEKEGEDSPEAGYLEHEHDFVFHDGAIQALSRIDPVSARVLGSLYGLWGRPVQTVTQLGVELGRSPDQVRKIRDAACRQIRTHLESEFHPCVKEYA